MAAQRPAGPPPTMQTSTSSDSLSTLNGSHFSTVAYDRVEEVAAEVLLYRRDGVDEHATLAALGNRAVRRIAYRGRDAEATDRGVVKDMAHSESVV